MCLWGWYRMPLYFSSGAWELSRIPGATQAETGLCLGQTVESQQNTRGPRHGSRLSRGWQGATQSPLYILDYYGGVAAAVSNRHVQGDHITDNTTTELNELAR